MAGDSLINRLDLYTLWTLRHEHPKVLERWPGRQAVPYAYERLTKSHPDKLCGCNRHGKRYMDCCQPRDQAQSSGDSFWHFMRFTQGQLDRSPPQAIFEFMRCRQAPPPINKHLTPLVHLGLSGNAIRMTE